MALETEVRQPTAGRLTADTTFALPSDEDTARSQPIPLRERFSDGRVQLVMLALAYYVGARLGFVLQSPLVPQSVLWLPNSILLAALIVTPQRRWPLMFLAAYPAQLLVGWQSHSPLLSISLIFLTNCADAALGATIWRALSPDEPRASGLPSMLVFLAFGATLPTIVVSFADAAITVATHWSGDFWLVFATRARANVLTNVIFVPAAVAVLTGERPSLWKQLKTRWREATVMLLALAATALLAFSRPPGSMGGAALGYLPLVFVVWSAVRFGVSMTGMTLIALAYLTTWMTMRGMGHATLQVATEVVPTLQFELLAIAVPVLCLSAVVQDRERAASDLAESQHALGNSLDEIRNLAGRLLSATEVERTRIARELHDDVNQQLAALGIGLSALKRHMPAESALREEVARLQGQAMHAADTVRILSHELHPAALRHAGLLPAMRELCAQYGRGESIRAILNAKREVSVSHEVALCVYRVTQEALRNAARHSGAQTVHVQLRNTADALELDIEDDGIGFDEAAARRRGGLGLTSMDERVRLVGGSVHVDTSPGRGTRISLRVPNGEMHGTADALTRG
ncbi:MAG: MASE1 domain-containing protein [Gemmatimonadaceae bacterium]